MLLLFNTLNGFAGNAGEDAPVVSTRKRPEKRPSGHAITAEMRARDRMLAIEQDDEELMMLAAQVVAMMWRRL